MGDAIFTPLTQKARQLVGKHSLLLIDGPGGTISVVMQLFCDQLHLSVWSGASRTDYLDLGGKCSDGRGIVGQIMPYPVRG
jgi:hypothetical protein